MSARDRRRFERRRDEDGDGDDRAREGGDARLEREADRDGGDDVVEPDDRGSGGTITPGAGAAGGGDRGDRDDRDADGDTGDTESPDGFGRGRTPDEELAQQDRLQSAVAADDPRIDEADIERVERTDDGVRPVLEPDAREAFARQRVAQRREFAAATGSNPNGPLSSFGRQDLQFEATDDGGVEVRPTDAAVESRLRSQVAAQSDRFDREDTTIVRVGQDERLTARVSPAAARREAREQLAARDDVDAEDVVVTQPEPGRFVAEEREGAPVSVDVNSEPNALFARARGERSADAPLDVDASADRSRRTGQIAAAGLAGVAVPEPTSSVTGGLVAGGAVATALAADAVRRSDEVGLGDGVQRTEVEVGDQSVNELEATGSVGTTTEVEPGEPTVQEVEPGGPEDVTEVGIGGGSGETTAEQPRDDTVVPEQYPLAGRDFAADPRRDAVQQETDPEAVLETGAVIDNPTGTGDLPSPGETPEIGESDIGTDVGTGSQSEVDREFPTGAEAVVSEEIGRAEAAAEPEVTAGAETPAVSEREVDGQVAGSGASGVGSDALAPAVDESATQSGTGTAAIATGVAGAATTSQAIANTAAASSFGTATETGVETTPVTVAETATPFEQGFETTTTTGTTTETVGTPSTPTPRTPGIPTPPIPGVPGGGGGGRGTALETSEDEVFSSGILTGDEAFELFFGDEDES